MTRYCGRVSMSGWPSRLPLFVGPVFTDKRHPFRSATGLIVNVRRRAFYVFWDA